jgi:glycosyltransferase involved in cell wall biosynthesis
MAQTWEPKEIIIVDDGSKDETFEVARQFECEWIKVVTQKNQGASAARNKAFSLCKGDYIQWLDADDLLAPDKIARQMEAVHAEKEPRTLLSSAWGHFMYRPSRARFISTDLWSDLSPAEFLLRKMDQKIAMQTATWLVSRELSEAAGPWDTSMYVDDDGEYFCRVLLASNGVRFMRESRVYYRAVGTSSLSYIGRSDKKLEALWRSLQIHISSLRLLDDGSRARQACLRHLQNYVIDFYPIRLDIIEKMKALANELGGRVDAPRLSWKYSWIRKIFGWNVAHRVQLALPSFKWSVIRFWDKTAFFMGGGQIGKLEV